ncbi:MAG: hypothetical protein ACRD0J_18290, partial [Acidimicrobiales bacterium]
AAPCGPWAAPAPSETGPADVAGRGCARIDWSGGVLTVAGARGRPVLRFSLGRPGDELLMGDWSCGGGETPAVYRPSTGQVFVWYGWAGASKPLRPAEVTATGVRDGDPVVLARRARAGTCALVRVLSRPGPPAPHRSS